MTCQVTAETLPSTDEDRLARILDDYLTALENGTPVSPEEVLDRNPQDAEQLRGYLSGLKLFHQAAIHDVERHLKPQQHGEPFESPRVIGDFRLVREIGRGGMGVVYEAWQMSLRRLVALKVLPFNAAHDAKQLGRFRNEAQAAAQVQHPNIVPVYAVGEESGIPYYAMQFIAGQSLAKVLNELRLTEIGGASSTITDRSGAVTVDDALPKAASNSARHAAANQHPLMSIHDAADHVRAVARLGVQAAEALHAAHEYGVVHRDVKPSNLLVDDHGQLWVTDFGLARCRENGDLTQTGDVLGTMRYMSPEQALGRTTLIDHRTDVFSLGVTLYELATLVHPADGVNELQLYFDCSRPTIKPLRRWNPQIPIDFQTIVMKSIAEFPSERYSTAREMANDLERFLAGKPILATPPSAATRASKWARRHRRVLTAVMIAAFIGLVTHTLLLTRERAARETALARASQSLDHAHAVLDRFGSRLVDQLAAIPGAEGVRHHLLQDSLDLYREFEQQASGEESLTNDLAFAYGKMGSLAEKLGDAEQAGKLHRKANDLWKARLAEDPNDAESVRNLALCENNLAMLFAQAGRTAEALALLQQAANKQDRLAVLDPNTYGLDLAATRYHLGQVRSQIGDHGEAVQEFKEAVALQERLSDILQPSEDLLSGLSASYDALAALLATSDPNTAIELYRKSVALRGQLVQADSINRLYQGHLARSYTNLGSIYCGRKDWRNAELCYVGAIRIQENLVSASPFATAYRRDLAISYNNLGMAQSRAGRLQLAESSFRKADELQRRLLADQPKNPRLASNQASVLNNLGMLLDRKGQAGDAESAFCEAVQLQKQALDASPESAQYRVLLSRHYFNYARNLRSQRKFDESVTASVERGALWPNQAEQLQSVARELAATYRHMAETDTANAASNDRCARAAVDVLREALAAGLPPERLQRSEFDALAGHAAYRALLMETGRSGPKTVAEAAGFRTIKGNTDTASEKAPRSPASQHVQRPDES